MQAIEGTPQTTAFTVLLISSISANINLSQIAWSSLRTCECCSDNQRLYSKPLEKLFRGSGQREICYIKVEDAHRELAVAADAFYGSPSLDMTMFAVTGTNGKTTTASIISDVFSRHRACGYMGTIALKYGNTIKKTSLTTPDPVEIQAALAEMREHGMQAAAMEVSSHGLAMRRTESIDFDCAVFTNLTYDHLDYHKTMDNYFDAKKTLFRGLKKNAVAVLNRDDEKTFSALAACSAAPYVSYGIDNEADYMALDLKLGKDGSEFTLRRSRSEERRVGKECRSRWSPYH